jgi:hypothetical protein
MPSGRDHKAVLGGFANTTAWDGLATTGLESTGLESGDCGAGEEQAAEEVDGFR